jgi:hypothetical protein
MCERGRLKRIACSYTNEETAWSNFKQAGNAINFGIKQSTQYYTVGRIVMPISAKLQKYLERNKFSNNKRTPHIEIILIDDVVISC